MPNGVLVAECHGTRQFRSQQLSSLSIVQIFNKAFRGFVSQPLPNLPAPSPPNVMVTFWPLVARVPRYYQLILLAVLLLASPCSSSLLAAPPCFSLPQAVDV